MNFYETLGLATTATKEEIKAAYKKLAKLYHPDNLETGNAELFKHIVHCFRMLTDPSYIMQEAKQHAGPIALVFNVSLEQALFGCLIEIHVKKLVIDGFKSLTYQETEKVDTTVAAFNCYVKSPNIYLIRSINFNFPQIEFSDGKHDVNLQFNVMEHSYYKFDQHGMFVLIDLPLKTALKGGTVEVETLFGLRTLRIKPGTDINDEYSVKNGDLPRLRVKIQKIIFPKKDKLKEEWKELNINWDLEEQMQLEKEDDLNFKF